MKIKLAHAVALAGLAVAAPAFADISPDSYSGGNGVLLGNGTGELFLVAYDPGNAQTYIVDLNLTVGSFITNSTTLAGTFSVTDAGFQSWLAGSANQSAIQWNLGGIYNPADTFGLLVTHGVGSTGAGATISGTELPPDGNALFVGAQNVNAFINDANSTLPGSFSDGGSTIGTGNALWFQGVWGPGYGGLLTFSNAATGFAATTTMLMSLLSADPGNPLDGQPFATLFSAGQWGVDAATGTISYGSTTTVVPLPAAVWLLGSGLLGLVGVGRRRGRPGPVVAA